MTPAWNISLGDSPPFSTDWFLHWLVPTPSLINEQAYSKATFVGLKGFTFESFF
jgi:hypothetical protein